MSVVVDRRSKGLFFRYLLTSHARPYTRLGTKERIALQVIIQITKSATGVKFYQWGVLPKHGGGGGCRGCKL